MLSSFLYARCWQSAAASMSEGLGDRVASKLETELNRLFGGRWGMIAMPCLDNSVGELPQDVPACIIRIGVRWNVVQGKFAIEASLFARPTPNDNFSLTRAEKDLLDHLLIQFYELADGGRAYPNSIEKEDDRLGKLKNGLNVVQHLTWWVEPEDIKSLLNNTGVLGFDQDYGDNYPNLDSFHRSFGDLVDAQRLYLQ